MQLNNVKALKMSNLRLEDQLLQLAGELQDKEKLVSCFPPVIHFIIHFYLSHWYCLACDRLWNHFFCLSVCLSVCDLSYGRNSHSILMKLCTVVWNPKSKIEFIRDQNWITPSPIFPQCFTSIILFQWAVPNTTVTMPVDRLWRLIAQRTLLGDCYMPKCLKML